MTSTPLRLPSRSLMRRLCGSAATMSHLLGAAGSRTGFHRVSCAVLSSGVILIVLSAAHAAPDTGVRISTCLAPPPLAPPPLEPPPLTPSPLTPSPLKPTRDRITQLPPTAAPERIVQPLPAQHRITEDPARVAMDDPHMAMALAAMERGLAFLRARQAPSGAWMPQSTTAPTGEPDRPTPVTVAVTALAIKALAQSERERSDGDGVTGGQRTATEHATQARDDAEAIARAIAFLRLWRTDDSSWGAGPLASYVNACVVMGLAATQDHRLRELIDDSVRALVDSQWDEGEEISAREDWFGGAGYGNRGRPDLSNTQMMLDALHDAGVSADDPAVQRALSFVTRTQNLHATNPADWAQAGADDGGFVYTPANGGESFANEMAGEGRAAELRPEGTPRTLRSYGSMTYAGLKSLIYAGLERDDPRVKAALGWIRLHLTFDENPGLGQQGLYYYYHAMARALSAAQTPLLSPASAAETGEQGTVNWREAMVQALVERQREDGAWRNETTRWLEGEEVLATIYAVLSLQECLKPVVR